MSRFFGRLKVVPVGDPDNDGDTEYQLLEPFKFMCEDGPAAGIKVICEKGFETDFVSVYRWLHWLIKPDAQRWREAATIHDKAVRDARDGKMTMFEADAILYEAMRAAGLSFVEATVFWAFTRLKHWYDPEGRRR